MDNIELNIEGKNGISERHISNDKFIHRTSYQLKLFPYSTKWSKANYNDFQYFNGITGECFRLALNKSLKIKLEKGENYSSKLKALIISNAIDKTTSSKNHSFKTILEDLFFQDDNLFCFDRSTLPYLSFKNESSTLKEISAFIHNVFFDDEIDSEATREIETNQNVLYKVIKDSLPKLKDSKTSTDKSYHAFSAEIVSLFKKDFKFISKDESFFLSSIDKLLKYYYFTYISQLILNLNDFFEKKTHPIYFTIEKEVVSNTRLAFQNGWAHLEKRVGNIFSHANALELLNYIEIRGQKPKDYKRFKELFIDLDDSRKEQVVEKIKELQEFYKSRISKPNIGWEECVIQLKIDSKYRGMQSTFEKTVYEFWFTINFQFLNTARKKPYNDYQLWFTEFCKANFLKRRGRIGYTLALNQEMLLFLTKLCVGDEEKIRLNSLWKRLADRGINFDESSRVEIVKLFEKINLIEKKSDSGDAQYVRRIL